VTTFWVSLLVLASFVASNSCVSYPTPVKYALAGALP